MAIAVLDFFSHYPFYPSMKHLLLSLFLLVPVALSSQGIPVIALLLYNRKSMHYVPVVGYDESHFFIQNSVEKYRNVKDNPSYNESLPIDQFDAMWNIPIECCQRLFVVVRKAE